MKQRQSSLAAWPVLGAAAAGMVLFAALTQVLAPSAAPVVAEPFFLAGPPPVRACQYCGWIESKREIVPGVPDPEAAQVFEYTVRMRDGSSSVFEQALPATWRRGEGIIVIDSAADVTQGGIEKARD
jgi:hypothetical protein